MDNKPPVCSPELELLLVHLGKALPVGANVDLTFTYKYREPLKLSVHREEYRVVIHYYNNKGDIIGTGGATKMRSA